MSDHDDTPEFRTALERREDDDDQEDSETDGHAETVRGP